MSAEGMGLTIGFGGLFITLVGLAVSGGIAYGTMKTMVQTAVKQLEKIDDENRAGHKEIFNCQKQTDVKVGSIEQHLISMNGSMKKHTDDIETLKRENHTHT